MSLTKKRLLISASLLCLAVLLAGIGGVAVYQGQNNGESAEETPPAALREREGSNWESAEDSPAALYREDEKARDAQRAARKPKEERAATKSAKILILNGNGVEGAANELKQTLTSEGYESVSTENALTWGFSLSTVTYHYEPGNQVALELAQLAGIQGRNVFYSEADEAAWGEQYDLLMLLGNDYTNQGR